jgi:hypothetical protein
MRSLIQFFTVLAVLVLARDGSFYAQSQQAGSCGWSHGHKLGI